MGQNVSITLGYPGGGRFSGKISLLKFLTEIPYQKKRYSKPGLLGGKFKGKMFTSKKKTDMCPKGPLSPKVFPKIVFNPNGQKLTILSQKKTYPPKRPFWGL